MRSSLGAGLTRAFRELKTGAAPIATTARTERYMSSRVVLSGIFAVFCVMIVLYRYLAGGMAAALPHCDALVSGHSYNALAEVVAGLALVCSGVFIAQAAASSYVGAAATHDRGLAVGLYAMFYYAGGSAGGTLPALLWNSGGWRACVVLVVAVQMTTAAIGWFSWTGRHSRSRHSRSVRCDVSRHKSHLG